MDPATMWARSSYDEYSRGLGDYYRPGLGVAAGHGHEGAGGGPTNPYTAPPSSLAQAGLEDRQHEDTVSDAFYLFLWLPGETNKPEMADSCDAFTRE